MIISTRGRYALRVMIDIAQNGNDKYIALNDISARQNVSKKYLESILVLLTKDGLLLGLRGKGGGYKLAKQPQEYTVCEILQLTEGCLAPVACLKKDAVPCPKAPNCKTLPLWKGLHKTVINYLESKTLADLINGDVEI